ncbi:hypothetical protein [Sinosporangium siamense]|uniref:Uncharacterized protein n=1 Tax=Sinosporangium siamense TaxID=1367973 RepID=A0A919RGR0_9ACTN|nr:hypothetical protein [Sinosporangium siamense]GII93072.1 hypothetical protein Ssi02_33030 [Sinosporangium siamense]
MPPFAAPHHDDGAPHREDPLTDSPSPRRRPYDSPATGGRTPTGDGAGTEESAPGGPPGRVRNRPDKLVASGPPRKPYSMPMSPRRSRDISPAPEPPKTTEPPEDPVHRVGGPPTGRPTRPDLLAPNAPPDGQGPGSHRAVPPSALRRSTPTRRRRRGFTPLSPIVLVAVAIVLAGVGVIVWQGVGPFATGLRLAAGEGRPGDGLFAVPSGGGGSNQVLNAVTSDGATIVAVGSDTTSPVPRPLFLTSDDNGATWRLGKVKGPAGTATTVGRVVGGDGKWLAVSSESPTDSAPAARGFWSSDDGREWVAADSRGLSVFQPVDQVTDIARTEAGFVAVGGTPHGGGMAPVAWVSADGREWDRIDSKKIGGPDKVQTIKAVVARGKSVVALAEPGQGDSASIILRSSDGGRTWKRTGASLADVAPRPGALAALRDAFVLVPIRQRTDDGDVRVYCSPSGAEWRSCGSIKGFSRDGGGVNRLTSFGSGVAAIAEKSWERYVIHTSTNGKSWSKHTDLGKLPKATLRDLTISGGGTLVVGGDRAGEKDNQLVLMTAAKGGPVASVPLKEISGLTRVAREINRVAVGEGRYVTVGSAAGEAGIWTGTGGDDWAAAGPAQILSGPGKQTLTDVAYGPQGWLAVGSTMSGAAYTRVLAVSSADGRTWRGIPAEGPLAAKPDLPYLAAHAVAAGETGYVLAGEEGGLGGRKSAALWFTSDLRQFTRAGKLPAGGTNIRIHDVAATSEGFVAVGGAGGNAHEDSVVWLSAGGTEWTQRKGVLPPEASSAGLRHVAVRDGRIVAIGTAQVQGVRRTFSAASGDNGSTWEYAWIPADEASAVQDVAGAPDGFVAVGWHGAAGDGDSAAWISEDGLAWQRQMPEGDGLAGAGTQYLGAVVESEGEVIALGRSTTYSADHLLVWRTSFDG